jgi:hypothetical protein
VSEARRMLEVDGCMLDVQDGEPRIRDVDLGEVLGYERPRVIRELIERNLDDLPGIQQRRAVRRYEIRPGVEHSQGVAEYHLSEAEALFIAARSETPAGAAVLRRLIDVFLLARRGLLAEAQAAAGAPPPSITVEQAVLLAARVAAETAVAVVAGRRRGRRARAAAQGDLFSGLRREPRVDPWKARVEAFLASLPPEAEITTLGVFNAVFGVPLGRFDRAAATRIGTILGGAGWAVHHRRRGDTGRMRVYVRAVTTGSA